jgi:hypothetical protein
MKQLLATLILSALLGGLPLGAMETDQFNLPPVPLADIAPEVEAHVAENLQTALDKLNTEIAVHERCISGASESGPAGPCLSEKHERSRLEELRSPDAVVKAVYDQLGKGTIFHANTGNWLNSHKFEHEPSRYKAPFTESIYWELPINYATLSPTIRMYGVEFGTDKLDHMFQQGYTYYRKYAAALKEGKSENEALKAAVRWGRSTENLFYGYAVSGVYSNADLAANIAGLKFYQNLTRDIQLGTDTKPSILTLTGGKWMFTRNFIIDGTSGGANSILGPLITDHLNEALNPSNYLPVLYNLVKRTVKKRACPEWRAAFPTLTRYDLAKRTDALTTWNGLDYGYKKTSRQVHLDELCFDDARGKVVAK